MKIEVRTETIPAMINHQTFLAGKHPKWKIQALSEFNNFKTNPNGARRKQMLSLVQYEPFSLLCVYFRRPRWELRFQWRSKPAPLLTFSLYSACWVLNGFAFFAYQFISNCTPKVRKLHLLFGPCSLSIHTNNSF